MSGPHEVEVAPYAGTVDEYVVRCRVRGCWLFERYPTREAAEARRDEHRAETS